MAGGAAALSSLATACGGAKTPVAEPTAQPTPESAAAAPSTVGANGASTSTACDTAASAARTNFLVDVFETNYGEQMRAQASAWQGKFRKMSAGAFPFYRGSAAVYYTDLAGEAPDPFVTKEASRIWIQGDLHAENFGSYLDSTGRLIFDVNDFDEAYVGPYIWDVKRFTTSLALIGYDKALSDDQIRALISDFVDSYTGQVKRFAESLDDKTFALTLDNTQGVVKDVLVAARQQTRLALLDNLTEINDGERKFIRNKVNSTINDGTRAAVETTFKNYLQTLPQPVQPTGENYRIMDATATQGFGIGSAGLRMYSLLLGGPDETLDNDVILAIKQSRPSAVAIAVKDQNIKDFFKNQGQRAAISRRALQAPHADQWLGYSELDGAGVLVSEVSPYGASPEWDDINKFDDLQQLVKDLGRVVAKIHCVSDEDSDQKLISGSADKAILAGFSGKEEQFTKAVTDWSEAYAQRTRDDHRLFADAFRNGKFPSLRG
jgi:uncharacterized protein (DUF2252 family)